jgi:hypothetical protein
LKETTTSLVINGKVVPIYQSIPSLNFCLQKPKGFKVSLVDYPKPLRRGLFTW